MALPVALPLPLTPLFAFNETVRYFMNNNSPYSRAFGAFLDISKAFDKVLHNGLFKKLLDRNVSVCLVLLLNGMVTCSVLLDATMLLVTGFQF